MQRQKKLLIFLAAVAIFALFMLDLAAPSVLKGVKGNLPKDIRNKLPLIESLTIVAGIAYLVGSFGLQRLFDARQRAQYREIGRQGKTREIVVPQNSSAAHGEMADMLSRLWDVARSGRAGGIPISFEYVASEGKIRCQVWVPDTEDQNVGQAFRNEVLAKYPESRVLPLDQDLLASLSGEDDKCPDVAIVTELQLSGPAHHPIKLADEFKVDPLASILQAIGTAQTGVQLVAVQVVAVPAPPQEWQSACLAEAAAIEARTTGQTASFLGMVTGKQPARGRALTPDERKKLTILKDRVAGQAAFRAIVRIVAAGSDPQECQQRIRDVVTSFSQFNGTVVGPQGFTATRSYAFRPCPPESQGGQDVERELSESKIVLLQRLKKMMGEHPLEENGNGAGPDGPETETSPRSAEPVEEAQPLLCRMPPLVPRFWPPWGTDKRSIILAEGLATVFHFPHKALLIPGLVMQTARHIPPPHEPLLSPKEPKPEGWLVIAAADDDRDPPWLVGMPYEDLRRGGMYILGPAGTGKSVLLEWMGCQFLKEGRGLSVIDAKEDLARALAKRVPLEREGEVAWVHPSSYARPVVVNFLDSRVARQIGWELVLAGAMAIYQKMVGANWDTSTYIRRILRNATAALLEGEPRSQSSLIQLYAFLQEDTDERPNTYRAEVVRGVTDPLATTFWQTEYPTNAKEFARSAMSVRTRVEEFLSNPIARYLMGLPFSTINFRQIMDERMIFLSAVPDTLGDVQPFVGALLFNLIASAGFSRYNDLPNEEDRVDHVVVVDEFQTFAAKGSQDMQNVLSKLRGARVAPVLAHQSTEQIDAQTMGIILANNETRIIFCLKAEPDARMVGGPWKAQLTIPHHLMGLQPARHEVYMSCLVNGQSTGVFSARTRKAPTPKPEDWGLPLAAGFVWPVETEYDEWVNYMAALEREIVQSSRAGDRKRKNHFIKQAVSLLKEMSQSQYGRYVQRRQQRDAAEREFILRHPSVIPDKMARIEWLSALRFGIPLPEAEFLTTRALIEAGVLGTSGGTGESEIPDGLQDLAFDVFEL